MRSWITVWLRSFHKFSQEIENPSKTINCQQLSNNSCPHGLFIRVCVVTGLVDQGSNWHWAVSDGSRVWENVRYLISWACGWNRGCSLFFATNYWVTFTSSSCSYSANSISKRLDIFNKCSNKSPRTFIKEYRNARGALRPVMFFLPEVLYQVH